MAGSADIGNATGWFERAAVAAMLSDTFALHRGLPRPGPSSPRRRARPSRSPEEGELGEAGDVGALPGPDESGIPGSRAGADPHVVLLVGLEAAAAEQIQAIEAR